MEKNTSQVLEPASESLLSGSGAGSRLFVINLCASMAPVQVPGKSLPGLESYRLYQVARMEDGRTRHRLRLGFFADENEAGMVLASVRAQYPTAFTTCLCDEDRRFTRGYTPAAAGARAQAKPAKPVAVPAPASMPAPPKATAAPAIKTPAAAAAAPNKPQAAAPKAQAPAAQAPKPQKAPEPRPPREAEVIELTWEPEAAAAKPAAAAPQKTSAAVEAKHAPEIELSWEEPSAPKPESKQPAPAATQAKRDEVHLPPSKGTIDLKLEAEPAHSAAKAAVPQATSAQPFHVGKGADIPNVKLNLAGDAQPVAASAASKPAVTAKPAPASKPAMAANVPARPAAAAKPAPAAQKPAPAPTPATASRPAVTATSRGLDMALPELDSTQTIRALTSTELSDENQEKWFAIQLAVSDQPVNLDAMPRLDIFEAYRLYSVATAGSGKIVHSLRLGFFREAVSAEAVSGYLKTFFGSPSVMRISVAEQLRFKDAPVRKAPAKAESNVVTLNARERNTATVPTVTVEVTPKVDTAATGSFKPNNTGSFKAHNTGSFKAGDTGSFKADSTGTHRAAQVAAKSAVATRVASTSKTSATGKFRAMRKPTLQEQLLQEAREVELSESAIRKLPKNGSLLSRLVGKLTK